MILPIIMAGGSGSRLWPLSRTHYPKQFLALTGQLTMLQETIIRLKGIAHQSPLIICNEEHRFIVAEQLRQQKIQHSGIILEPVGRNTAPAVALAALQAIKQGDDPILLVLAADHIIQNVKVFINTINQAVDEAKKNKLVTLGIIASTPETGYGYIKRGCIISNNTYSVDSFIEKPNLEMAQRYVDSGDYYWNSGIFLFKASRYLEELQLHRPDIVTCCKNAILNGYTDLDFIRLSESIFATCPDESIDYAIMEQTKDAVVISMNADWSDIGSWASLWDISKKDKLGNVCSGDVLLQETYHSYVRAQSKLVTVVGVNNLIVVETKDALLIANKSKVQDVKKIVAQLKHLNRIEHKQHREVFRPWGSYDSIGNGDHFRVNQLIIKPGEQTATQIHYHRSEHWVIVLGTAEVKQDSHTFLLRENESTYISVGVAHSVCNLSKVPLVIIEVQTGSYFEEDDVIRTKNYVEQNKINEGQ